MLKHLTPPSWCWNNCIGAANDAARLTSADVELSQTRQQSSGCTSVSIWCLQAISFWTLDSDCWLLAELHKWMIGRLQGGWTCYKQTAKDDDDNNEWWWWWWRRGWWLQWSSMQYIRHFHKPNSNNSTAATATKLTHQHQLAASSSTTMTTMTKSASKKAADPLENPHLRLRKTCLHHLVSHPGTECNWRSSLGDRGETSEHSSFLSHKCCAATTYVRSPELSRVNALMRILWLPISKRSTPQQ